MGENLGSPKADGVGSIGKSGKEWGEVCTKAITAEGVTYTLPTADGTNGQVLKTNGSAVLSWTAAGGATAFDDIGDPDAAGTVAFTTYAQTLTSTKTDGDMLTISGLGNFGDVSVVRIESKTGNPTDGTVLEVVSHDANVDPLVVSSSAQAGVLTVGQGGTVSIVGATGITGATTVTGALSSTGLVTATGGISAGSASNSYTKTDTVTVSNAELKALRAAPKALVAAPGAGKYVELLGAQIIMDYGSNVLTESADNLVIQYNTSGVDACTAIDSTGFLDQNADMIAFVTPIDIAGAAATSFVNKALELFNNGDAEFGGNAANDTTLIVKVSYRIHTTGLA